MTHRGVVLALALGAIGGAAEPALAIPAFARRYGVACHFCHQGYPKLNAMGQRFKERGFRMSQEDPFDLGAWARSVPLSLFASARHDFGEDREGVNSAFLKPISAGHVGKRLSYWIDDGFLLAEAEDGITHTRIDNGWARLEVITGGKLYAKAGRFELDLPFGQVRTSNLFSYEIYFANTGFESDSIGDYQDGVELGGDLPKDVRWSAALVKGRDPDGAERIDERADRFDANLFLRLSRVVGQHRFGAFAYIGRNTLVLSPGVVWDDDILRLGADASVWLGRLNLYGVGLFGRNDNSVADAAHPSGTEEPLSFGGGFLQGDFHWSDELALTLRLNVVSRPPGQTNAPRQTFGSVFPGLKLWLRERLRLSFEYGFLNKDRPGFGAVQAAVAF